MPDSAQTAPTTNNTPTTTNSTRERANLASIGVKEAWYDAKVSLVMRDENAGMDLGSHNVTLEYMAHRKLLR